MRKILLTIWATGFFGFCFAPIQLSQKPVNGVRLNGATEQDLQREQGQQKTMGVVGTVPEKTDVVSSGPQQRAPDASGSGILAQANNRLSSQGNSEQAKEVLVAAQAKLDEKKQGPFPMILMGGLFLCLGFGAVFGLRQWANKNMPDLEEQKKLSW